MSALIKRITVNESICNGRPTIRGYRVTVQTILEFLLAGSSEAEVLEQYPFLEPDDIKACKEFAFLLMNNKYSVVEIAA